MSIGKGAVSASLACIVLALGLVACGGGKKASSSATPAVKGSAAQSSAPGKHVTIDMSAPAADHGWLAAISNNAKAQAKQYSDVTFHLVNTATTAADQEAQIETMIKQKPDVLVILPFDGAPLTPVALKAMKAGIPVIDIDREFTQPGAARAVIEGDNYGVGYQAGLYFAQQLHCSGDIAEIQGLAGISVTQQRSQGFQDGLKSGCPNGGINIVARQPADFLPTKGQQVTATILRAHPEIKAIYTHDDDMAQGVVAAIKQAGKQNSVWITGVGPSAAAMKQIQQGGLYRATFTYSPIMSASAVSLARLLGQGKGLSELAEPSIPNKIVVPSDLVDKANVGQYLKYGF
jgi:ribose transport system substrate-binding protein